MAEITRILCLISGMNAGGAETFLMKIYRTIDRSKYQMDFCVNIKEKGFYDDEIEAMGGRIYHIPSKSESVSEFKSQLTRIVRENGYDHVLRVTSSAMGFMDLKIAKKAGARVCAARSSNSSDGKGIKAYVAHRLGKFLYNKYVDVKIAPSDLAAIYTFGERAYKKGRVSILHNAVDLGVYHFDAEARRSVREEFGIPEHTRIFGHVGRLSNQKNHSFLLDVFKRIHEKDEKSVLLLVGKGPLESQIKEKVDLLGLNEAVIFAGVRSDVPRILSAMDAFVFPSFYEGMPNTVIEAQATGLPCVIADTITKEANITGLVEYLPLGDAELWSDRSLAAISEDRADTTKAFIENKYDIGSVADEFISFIVK